jgi:glycosyltransferase involved in cell wall biosynthesis
MEPQLKLLAANRLNIIFLPFQNQKDMPVVYRIGDVFVLPSRGPGETWGLAINEAMACGRPVIVSDRCGCAQDLVKENVNGYIFEAESFYGLAQCMRKMIESTYRKEMSEASYIKIKDFSYDSVCNSIEKILLTD